jgi:hypothetical protein
MESYIAICYAPCVGRVLPGLGSSVSCLSGPVRPLRLVVCVISSLPSARLSPEGSRLLSYLCICIACYRTCMYSRYFRLRIPATGRRPLPWYLLSCPSRSSRYLCVVMFWSYLAAAGNAPFGQSRLCHPFIYGYPASPLLSRTPITKYIIYHRVKSTLAPQHPGPGH